MKSRITIALTLLAVLAYAGGLAQATTVGFVGAAGGNNQDIPVDYASNVAADGTGWTVSDGTGATPDVALYWGGGHTTGTGWDWEYHTAATFEHIESLQAGGAWDAVGPPTANAVAQLQDYRNNGALEVQFLPSASVAVVVNSFDIGNAYDQIAADGTYGFHIELVKDSDSSVVWSHDTPLWGVGTSGREESVTVGYTGDFGESYTLTFARLADTDPGNLQVYRSALDNLSFSQIVIPEPTSVVLVALCGVGLIARRRCW